MDRAERNELVEKNIGLVHACANKFRGKGAEYDDLFQAGCVGLIKAAENFDPERGFSFSTYAVPVILGEIKRIFRDGGSVKVGRALKEKARKAHKTKARESRAFFIKWRKGRDSNPRYGITVYRISSPAHSTTLPPFRTVVVPKRTERA